MEKVVGMEAVMQKMLDEMANMESHITNAMRGRCNDLEHRMEEVKQKTEARLISLEMDQGEFAAGSQRWRNVSTTWRLRCNARTSSWNARCSTMTSHNRVFSTLTSRRPGAHLLGFSSPMGQMATATTTINGYTSGVEIFPTLVSWSTVTSIIPFLVV